MRRFLCPLILLGLACGDPPSIHLERVGHLDTIDFAPELGIDTATLTQVASKLYIETLESGTGRTMRRGDFVVAHVTGWFPSGERFTDSGQGAPHEFRFGGGPLVRGIELGMQGMKVGERRRIIVPPAMAYGAAGQEGVVPPYATLVFEVELLGIL